MERMMPVKQVSLEKLSKLSNNPTKFWVLPKGCSRQKNLLLMSASSFKKRSKVTLSVLLIPGQLFSRLESETY